MTVFAYSAAVGLNDGTSWENAYTSLNTTLNVGNVAAGDVVLVSGSFNEIVSIDVAGTTSAVITIQGDDRSGGAGVGLPAEFTVDGESSRANCLTTTLSNGTNAMYALINMVLTGATSHGSTLNNLRHVTYKKFKSHSHGGMGVQADNTSHMFEQCKIYNNASIGLLGGTNTFIGVCEIFDNGAEGALCQTIIAYNSAFYGNTGDDIECNSTNGSIFVLDCLIDGEAKTFSGVRIDGSAHRGHVLMNSLITDVSGAGGIAVNVTSNDLGEVAISSNNLLFDNTTDYVNADTFTGEATTDPVFVDKAAHDYSLDTGSGAKGAGVDAGDL